MKLCRKLINGNVFVNEEESGIFEYEWHEVVPEGYEEALLNGSAIEGIDAFGKRADNSYSYARYEINQLLIAAVNPDFSNWANGITTEEKRIVSKYVLAPYALRVPTFYSDADDKINADIVLAKTLSDRTSIIELMRKEVFHTKVRTGILTLAQSQQFFKDVNQFVYWYLNAACADLKQWITNEVGSSYETDGFEQKTYWSQDLEDTLMNIYNNY